MTDFLAEGRELLAEYTAAEEAEIWSDADYLTNVVTEWLWAHGEALLAVAALARAVSDAHNAVDDLEHHVGNCAVCRATLRNRVAKLDEKLAALNPGDARDHADAGASPGEGETQK